MKSATKVLHLIMAKIQRHLYRITKDVFNFVVPYAGGVAKNTFDIASDAIYGINANKKQQKLITKLNLEKEKAKLRNLKLKNEYPYSDACIISGLTAYQMTRSGTPPDVEKAYELAFPELSSTTSFIDSWESFDSYEQRLGFVNAVKGKLFEIKYVDHMNATLENGYYAEIASSPVQQDWDIIVRGPNNETVDLIQAKASTSVSYVKEAIENNPSIDVVTLSNLQGQLAQSSFPVTASGISNSDLINEIGSATSGSGELLFPSAFMLLGVSWIAFDNYSNKDLSLYQKHYRFGKRSGNHLANLGIVAVTGILSIPLILVKEGYLNNSRNKRKVNNFLKEQIRNSRQTTKFWERKMSRREFLTGLGVAKAAFSDK